ncbi:MAG: hypothetical protein EBX52_08615 [Proteobacteria bacterium]|nr:hypothetical protein [Pseudomonadota bacterium]
MGTPSLASYPLRSPGSILKSTLHRKASGIEKRHGVSLLRRNRFGRVLKNRGTEREPVYSVYPDQPYVPLKTRVFVDYLEKTFK